MITIKLPKHSLLGLSVLVISLLFMTEASARPDILALAVVKGIRVSSCLSCHTSMTGGTATLRPNIKRAYDLDKVGLTRLKNLINGCPAGQVLNISNFLCERLIAISSTVGLATSGAARSDVYAVTCGTGSAFLDVEIKDNAPAKAALVTIQSVKNALVSPLSIDTVDGDALYSPTARLSGGVGVYWMIINKSLSSVVGLESYTAKLSCRNSVGTQTATSLVIKQNQ